MWIGVILKVAFGLGAVIFVHELGHFLVAKACGVKCEKFMIGFDIGGYKLSWRRGETEYGIGILPLGGYVKMLGQDDDPAHIAEQMQKSQVDARSSDAVPVTGPSGETYYVDRRSYLAKSVPQRMAIISAGVIMNVIFAFIFAVIAYGLGVPYLPAIVSETVPGSPAWQENIPSGSRIVKINDTVDPTFLQLRSSVTLGDLEHGIPCEIRLPSGEVVSRTLKPRQDGGLATIGIGGPQSLELIKDDPVVDNSSAARATLVAPAGGTKSKDATFVGKDTVVRVGDMAVKNYGEFQSELARHFDEPIQVTVRRDIKKAEGEAAKSVDGAAPATQELTFEVPAQPLHLFDVAMKIGPITAVQNESPAEKAGLIAGDFIEKIDGKLPGQGPSGGESLPAGRNPMRLDVWDAETLPDYLRRAARDGRDVEVTVTRTAADGKSEPVTVRVKPEVPTTINASLRSPGTPMGANEIGIAYRITSEVAAVEPQTAAANELKPGDKFTSAKVIFPPEKKEGDTKETTPPPIDIKLAPEKPGWLAALIRSIFGGASKPRPEPNWPTVLDLVRFAPAGTEVEVAVERGDAESHKVKLTPRAVEGAFLAARGFVFEPIQDERKAGTFGQQVRYGWDETAEALTLVFRFLKKLGTQVPISALGGPVTIAKAAGYSAAESMSSLLIFLTMLSANLAVINLLPIPLLDGGHLVFLAYEGIRRRPANEKFVVALHTAGFVLIVSLMLYVLALDLELLPRNL
jgi:regulator of sigma E protease